MQILPIFNQINILPRPIQFWLSSITSSTKFLLHEGSSFEIIEYDIHLQILLLLFYNLILSVSKPCFITTILYHNSFALSLFHQVFIYDHLLFTFSSSLFFSLSFLHFLSQYIPVFSINTLFISKLFTFLSIFILF